MEGANEERKSEAVVAAAVFRNARRDKTILSGRLSVRGCAQSVINVRLDVETPLLTDARPRRIATRVDEIKAMFLLIVFAWDGGEMRQ